MLNGSPDRLGESIQKAFEGYAREVFKDPKDAQLLREIAETSFGTPFIAGALLGTIARPLLDKIFRHRH